MNQNNMSNIADAGARVATDFRTLASHAEELLKATKAATGDSVESARKQLTDTLVQARDRLRLVESDVLERGKQAAIASAQYARQHPWQIVAAAVAVGLLLGLITRSGDRQRRSDAR